MIKLLIQLFIQFFHIGIFSFGGGYATLPFLYDISEKFHWYSTSQLSNMLAVSSVTPGPVGVNMATFTGFTTAGIVGSVIATSAIVLPSFIFVLIVYRIINKFKTNKYIKASINALKPAGCALLSAVGIKLIFTSNLHLMGLLILSGIICSTFYKKFDPITYLVSTAVIGLVLGIFNMIGV